MADDVTVVDKGLEQCAVQINAAGATAPNWHEWGTGTDATVRTDVDLTTPSAEPREEGTETLVASGAAGAETDVYQTVATIESDSEQAITEMGLWTDETVGFLFLHAVFAAINVLDGNSIEFTVQTTFAPG